MDKKSKRLIWTFVLLALLSVGYTFYKTVILQDFEVIDSSEEDIEENDSMGDEKMNEGDEQSVELETEISPNLE